MKQPRQQGHDHRFDRIETTLDHYHKHLISLNEKMDDSIRRSRALKRRLDHIMATLAELQAAVASVGSDVTTIGTDAAEILSELKALRDGGGGAGGISPADLDPIIASLTAVHDSAKDTAAKLEAAALPTPPNPPNPPNP